MNIADLARAKRFLVLLTEIWTPGSPLFGSNGANVGARQGPHAFGVEDVDHCS
jgi:hypothetical protein